MQQADNDAAQKKNVSIKSLRLTTCVPVLLALVVVQLFRSENSDWQPVTVIEFVALFSAPFIMHVLGRRWTLKEGARKGSALIFTAQIGAALSIALVLIAQWLLRAAGHGDALEIVVLLSLQYVAWNFAVFSFSQGHQKTSFVLSAAVVFFVFCKTERVEVFALCILFSVFALWWMIGFYWNRLEIVSIDGHSRTLPTRGSTLVITAASIGASLLAVYIAPITLKSYSVDGFMPVSGGDTGYGDEFARAGVGEGDQLTSGTNANTTGPVDSDEFIEDHKPSLYDVISESYQGPVFRNQQNKAIPLSAIAKHIHDVKQAESTGRKFRTIREPKGKSPLQSEDEPRLSLFCVEGSVPARFAMNSFDEFDGWDWTKRLEVDPNEASPKIGLEKPGGKPVFFLSRFVPDFLTQKRSHGLKITRLDSSIAPTPPMLNRWHVPKVDRIEFFEIGSSGSLQMDDPIPADTTIEIESFVPSYTLLSEKPYSCPRVESKFLCVPSTESKIQIEQLAKEWTKGIRPGWPQVRSIVQRMQNEFQLNEARGVDPSTKDSVSVFLQEGGGPSYMFATTCVLVLRAAGYKARLTNGFLVEPGDFDHRQKQSYVTSANFHSWPEVRLNGKFWIPVEPTPGKPEPYHTKSIWHRVSETFFAFLDWRLQYPLFSALSIVFALAAFGFRCEIFAFVVLGWWFVVGLVRPGHLIKTTRQLIDIRFSLAGQPRPDFVTIRDWYSRFDSDMPTGFVDLWDEWSFKEGRPSISREKLVTSCRQQIDRLTLRNIRRAISNSSPMESK